MHRHPLLRTLAAGILLMPSIAAQTPQAPPPQAALPLPAVPDIAFTKVVLKNGLTLLVHEDHKAPIVAVNVWYHVGSKNERPGKTGFAHLFEHLMFNGSENFDDDYFKAVEPIGATDLNGTTNEDRTNYFQNVPVAALDRVLWLESDRMGHFLGVLDQKRLEEQRGVVQNEKRQGENEPYGKVWITIAENTFPKGHPYSWSVIGSMDDLDAASLDDVKAWFGTYYGPSNATIAIAGDIDAETALKKVERYFGDIAPGPPVIAQGPWIARPTGPHRQVMQDRVPQARVIKVWNIPEYGTSDATGLSLVADVLGGGRSSRLYKRLVRTDRIATDVSAFVDAREIASQLQLSATVQPGGDAKAVERAMDEEIEALRTKGPTAAEVERVKTQYLADFVRGIERIGGFGGKSDVLARDQVILGRPDAYKARLETVRKATPARLQELAREWLDDRVYVLQVDPFPTLTTTATDVDRKKGPAAGDPAEAPLPRPESSVLPNGLKLLLVRRTGLPMVELTTVFDGGFAADDPAAPGLSSMTLAMLTEGTQTRTSLQIAESVAALGAQLWTGSQLDVANVSLQSLTTTLDEALALYADVIRNPSFPASELARVKDTTLAEIQQEKVEPFGLALRVLPALLYGAGHPYAQPLTGSGTEAAVKAITPADLQRFHRTWFHPDGATVIAVGDITMADLSARLQKAFAGWERGKAPARTIPRAEPPKTSVFLLDRPGAEQSIIIGGTLIAPSASPDDFAFRTFNDAFGGAFSSRVNLNLREDKHWSYGAGSIAFDARGQRPWMLYAPVQTDKTKESLQELMTEFRQVISDRPIKDEELRDAKDRLTRTLAGRWETGNAVISALQEILMFDLPEDYYRTFAQKVRAVTTVELSKAVKAALSPTATVWVVVGDRAKVEAGIRELKMGPVQLLDAEGRPVRP